MKNKSRSLALLATGILWVGLTHAQESVNASGGDASGSGGTVSYSVGQIVYTTNSGSNGSVAHGVQQAYEIITVGINVTSLDISLTVFPNPTSDNLTLQISEYKSQKLSYKIFDLQGKILNSSVINSSQTIINMTELTTATYFIEIVNHKNKRIQLFKIIKN